ncbi:hypothetical protein BKA81DRAFT_364119 [Phyllosticta paracitricarpa]
MFPLSRLVSAPLLALLSTSPPPTQTTSSRSSEPSRPTPSPKPSWTALLKLPTVCAPMSATLSPQPQKLLQTLLPTL